MVSLLKPVFIRVKNLEAQLEVLVQTWRLFQNPYQEGLPQKRHVDLEHVNISTHIAKHERAIKKFSYNTTRLTIEFEKYAKCFILPKRT